MVADDPASTFSIDLDSAFYSFMHASLNTNVPPQADAVRVEELINYFPYDCASPQDKPAPFEAHASVIPSPWNTETKLMHIGIKGYELPQTERPRSNLVFLIDSSGSNERCKQVPVATQFVQIAAIKLAT